MKYKVHLTKIFKTKIKKLFKQGRIRKNHFEKVFKLLENNPFYKSLKTHKVETKNFDQAWSSRIDGDLRLIWNFDNENKITILILDIGGHSGGSKVYN